MTETMPVLEARNVRVLTTPQLAEKYGCSRKTISYNFQYNRKKYIQGKHYIELRGDELRQFKNRLDDQDSLKHASVIYLWTEKGALLHAKSLNTDKAWEVYDYLVDFYFRAKGQQEQKLKSQMKLVVNIPENPEAQRMIQEVKKSLETIDSLIDGSNNYITEEKLMQFKRSIADAFRTFSTRTTNYLNVPVVKIEKPY